MEGDKIIKNGLVFERRTDSLTVNIYPEGQPRTSENTEAHTIAEPTTAELLAFIERYFSPPASDPDESEDQDVIEAGNSTEAERGFY